MLTVCHDIPELIRKAGGKKVTIYERWKWNLMDYCREFALRKSSIVFCNSEFVRREVIKRSGVHPEKTVVAYCGVDRVFFDVDEEQAAKRWRSRICTEKFILTFACGDPRENSQLLPYLLAALRERGVRKPIVIAGVNRETHYFNELDASFKGLGFSENVDFVYQDFLGPEDRGALAELYAAADLYLDLSGHEGFGMQLAEAMAVGVKCVSSGKGALSEIGGKYVKYFHGFEVEAIADCVKATLAFGRDPLSRQKQVDFARRYDWAESVRLIHREMEKIIHGTS